MPKSDSIHIAARCDFCGTRNELTIKDVAESQVVHCSHCGGVLGALSHLREQPSEAPNVPARQ